METTSAPPGRPLREAIAMLRDLPRPDPQFADDLEAIIRSTDRVPNRDPWADPEPPAREGQVGGSLSG
jgi:hypothetical protein